MDTNNDLTFLFYELFEEKKRINSYANKERKKLEYLQKENQRKVDEMRSQLKEMERQRAEECIKMAKQLMQESEERHGELPEVKALFKIIYMLAGDLLNIEAIEIETGLQNIGASTPLIIDK